jgi:ribonuclease Z
MSFSLTILGTSSALPTSKRNLTAHLVNHDERFFLIDCGEGTQIQLRRYKTKFTRINHIFISHLHGDHVFGLFGLISTLSMMGRKAPLHIYSISKLEDILKSHFAYFQEDIQYPIIFHHFEAKVSQVIYNDKKLEISTIPLKHRIPCVGFLFKELPKSLNIKKETIDFYNLSIKDILRIKNGEDYITPEGKTIPNKQLTSSPILPISYAYCTDTKASDSIEKYINGVTLLYHEATFLAKDAKLAKSTYHSTTEQAANIALQANAQKLIIGHFSSRYKTDDLFLSEAKSIFENTILAEDGLTIQIQPDK